MAETSESLRAANSLPLLIAAQTDGAESSPARDDQDDDSERLRGIVALPRPRNVLFIDEVELDRNPLPHWRPQITIDERRLTDEEHE